MFLIIQSPYQCWSYIWLLTILSRFSRALHFQNFITNILFASGTSTAFHEEGSNSEKQFPTVNNSSPIILLEKERRRGNWVKGFVIRFLGFGTLYNTVIHTYEPRLTTTSIYGKKEAHLDILLLCKIFWIIEILRSCNKLIVGSRDKTF